MTPAVLLDLDVMERNLTRMQTLVKTNGKSLRPHAKTHKIPRLALMQIAAGATGITVAKMTEAKVMASAGVANIFVANQIVDPRKLEELALLARIREITLSADSPEVIPAYSEAAQKIGVSFGVRIEADTGLGRTGVRSVGEALSVARTIAGAKGLELAGLYTHEGQLYRYSDAETRETEAKRAAQTMRFLADALRTDGHTIPIVSMGSSPGAPILAHERGIDELRPGVYLFNDVIMTRLGVATWEDCALTVLATVISVRPGGRVLIDAGTKTFASDTPFAEKTYGLLPDYPNVTLSAANEEHGYLDAPDTEFRVGDKVRIIPNHACTCVNLHDTIYTVRDECVEEKWHVAARGAIL